MTIAGRLLTVFILHHGVMPSFLAAAVPEPGAALSGLRR